MEKRSLFMLFFLALAITSIYVDALVVAKDQNSLGWKQVKVGFVANLQGRWGKMAHRFIKAAIADFYKKNEHYRTRLSLRVRHCPKNDVVTSAAIVEDLIQNEQVVAVIGPETSQEAQFDISLGQTSKVAIISHAASSPMLRSPYFIQATQNDLAQVPPITSLIHLFGWRQVTPIYIDNQFGGGMVPFLVDALQQINVRIPNRCVISSSATDHEIRHDLSKLAGFQTRVFVVHMDEKFASRVFSQARDLGIMSEGYVWIVTSNVANTLGYLEPGLVHESMQGVLGVRTRVRKPKAAEPHARDLIKSPTLQMSLFGLWAYDATVLLAKAVDQVHASNFTFVSSSPAVSSVGPSLMKALLNTSFEGLSGKLRLDANGKLPSSEFEIVNVFGSGEKRVGYWTPKGLNCCRTIIWPGDTALTPKGWAIPTNQRNYLKVGIPQKDGFKEFVDTSDPQNPTGFCIELFELVVKNLPYDLPVRYELASSDYDVLISQVNSKEYDAVVGDVTIIANRSNYVDFSLPYMESDVLMVVSAVKDSEGNKPFAFLKPLSWQLWVTTLFFFFLIAFVVWVNEYQINDEFRAESWRGQIGLCLFYSFSTMVFSQKEVAKSNLSRFVMVFWVFTLLLITQSYTASLSSTLTAEKLKPAYHDVDELLRHGKNVAYQNGTFVKEYLRNMKFHTSKMLHYTTPEELHQLFSKGTIEAAFDEAPYMKLFLSRYCSKYMTVVPPMPRTDGFAFVFPLGSPLVPDISRAVLSITEGDTMSSLTKKWLNMSDECPLAPSASANTSSSTLDLGSFAALFAITGGACLVAIVLKFGLFVYENRGLLRGNGSMSLKKRLIELNRSFHAMKGVKTSRVGPEPGESSRGATSPRISISEDARGTLAI